MLKSEGRRPEGTVIYIRQIQSDHVINIYFPVKPYIKGFYCSYNKLVIAQAKTNLLYSKVFKPTLN